MVDSKVRRRRRHQDTTAATASAPTINNARFSSSSASASVPGDLSPSSSFYIISPASGCSLSVACLVAASVAIVVYINTLYGDFIFDDFPALLRNTDALPGSSWSKLWVDDYWGVPLHSEASHKSWRPLTSASFKVQHTLLGTAPYDIEASPNTPTFWFHVVNVALHALVTALFVRVCVISRALSEPLYATVAGLAFALHPVHVEAVANVVGRAEMLAAVFFCTGLLAYLESMRARSLQKCMAWLLAALVAAALALVSKESGFTVLGVCIGYDLLSTFAVHTLVLPARWSPLLLGPSLPTQLDPLWRIAVLRLSISVFFFAVLGAARVSWNGDSVPFFGVTENPAAFQAK